MISVIVLIYNLEKELPDCIHSLRQIPGTAEDMEFILVDDGSTDSSGMIADNADDPRFRVFHTENRGYAAAINYGIEHARGEWIMLVDGDDWVEPGFCEIPLKAAQDFNADIVIFTFQAWKNGILWEDLFSEKVKQFFLKLTGKNGYFHPAIWNYRRRHGNKKRKTCRLVQDLQEGTVRQYSLSGRA